VINAQGFSVDCSRGSPRHVVHRFRPEERRRVLDIVNDLRFADLTPVQIVAILAEERIYVGSETTFYRIMRGKAYSGTVAGPVNHASLGPSQCWRQKASTSAGLGYHPFAWASKGSVLLSVHGDGCIESSHLWDGGA